MTYQTSPQITDRQRQILYGTILGGSSIIMPVKGKNCYLAMRDKNKEWLKYKVDFLSNLFKMDDNTIKKDVTTYRAYSVAYTVFNDMHDIFYKKGVKTITREILDTLTDQAWMVWFVDGGRKEKNRCYLKTQKFGEQGSNIVVDYFTSLECDCELRKFRGRSEIAFSENGSNEFMKVISSCLPSFIEL